ncbi:MAG: hypothetical protein FWC47_12745 [Oscillospiraceae bacterium]|nr:hypothetical protein [Oscillospiraceae bacterium]
MGQFLDRLNDLVFLDIKKDAIKSIVIIDEECVPLPIFTEKIINEELPMTNFIEGIFYCLGVCENIKNKDIYLAILKNYKTSNSFIKGEIYNNIKDEKIQKAYFLLRGLFVIEDTLDNYSKLLTICFDLAVKNTKFIDEMKDLIDLGKQKDMMISHLYESFLKHHLKDYDGSKKALEEYIILGGILTQEEENFKNNLFNIVNFSLGKEKIFDDPSSALKLLIPLLDDFSDDPSLLYYVALGYRSLQLNEKAIFYLKIALSIDQSFVDVLNELGLNHAILGQYNEAIKYFEIVYSSLKSIESINNLLLCYYYNGNKAMVSKLIREGKEVSKDDEIFLRTIEMINNI